MPATHTLLLFTAAVLGLMLSPGPNMAFVLSQSFSRGMRGGVAVAGGIFAADIVMTILTVLGVATLVAAWPPSFDLLRYAGAGYLVWLALQTWQRRRSSAASEPELRPLRDVFFHAVLVSLLNPKALLFFLVFLPQFVEPARGHVAEQLLWLGVLMSIVAFVFHSLLAFSCGQLRNWRAGHAVPRPWLQGLQSGVFLALAIRLFMLDRAGSP